MMDQPIHQYKPAEKLDLKKVKKEFPRTFKKIYCPSCDEEVNADNINLQKIIAKCGSCNVIFSIEEEAESLKSTNEIKQKILRPEGIDLFYYKDDLDITIQQHIQGFDAFGVIFLPLLAIFSIFIFFAKGMPAFFPIAFTISALYFIYKAFRYSNYKTYIDVSDRFLNIKSRPKNFQKDKTYAVNDIDQLYVRLNPSGYYEICMIVNGLGGQKHEKLITVKTLSKAKYLEQEIELYLNIEDRKVPEANV